MKKLDRYLIGTTLKILLICETTGVAIFAVIEFFEHIDLFASSLDNFFLSIAYLTFRIPYSANLILPLSFLISMLVTFILMIRNNEILAIRSSGISTFFFIRPLLYLSFILSLATFFVSEWISPEAYKISEYLFRVRIKKEEPYISVKNDRIWIKRGNIISKIDLFDTKTDTMKGVTVIELSPEYKIKRRIDAQEGFYTENRWVLKDAVERIFDEDGISKKISYSSLPGLILEPPQSFKNIQKNPDEMSFNELSNYIERLKNNGYDVRRYMVDLYNKIAFPFINFIMVTLACSIGLRYSKIRHISRGIFLGIVVGASYWFIHSLCLSLGYSEIFPPFFSAWLTNILFFSSGTIGILTLRT
ncbi:MAG: LPS export ABC transporter permease LptG [Deltaproteobacteria bacterium]|nr:LPS export ABC transporter permease LptG [Deltaproteobacteria bacterium]